MMAKMFYTVDEAKAALGKNDEELKQLTREGRLREFRDGPRVMFKADQVDTLKTELASASDSINLGPSDSGAPIGLVDSRSGSGAVLSLSDTAGPGSGIQAKEDTALAADLGLSGSIGLSTGTGLNQTSGRNDSLGGIPSPAGRGSGSGLSGLSGSGSGSKSGINVLGDEIDADASAQTAINPAISDQLNVEGMGSGSGLLDLTRESDNTSLGAVLDELPGGGRAGDSALGGTGLGMSGTGAAPSVVSATPAASTRVVSQPMYVEAKDPMSPAIGGLALGAAAFVLLGLFALSTGVMEAPSDLLKKTEAMTFPILAAVGAGLAVVGFIGGMVVGKIKG